MLDEPNMLRTNPYYRLVELSHMSASYFQQTATQNWFGRTTHADLRDQLANDIRSRYANQAGFKFEDKTNVDVIAQWLQYYQKQSWLTQTYLSATWPMKEMQDIATLGGIAQTLEQYWDITTIDPEKLLQHLINSVKYEIELPKAAEAYVKIINAFFPRQFGNHFNENGHYFNVDAHLEFLYEALSEAIFEEHVKGIPSPALLTAHNYLQVCFSMRYPDDNALGFDSVSNPLYYEQWNDILKAVSNIPVRGRPFLAVSVLSAHKNLIDACQTHLAEIIEADLKKSAPKFESRRPPTPLPNFHEILEQEVLEEAAHPNSEDLTDNESESLSASGSGSFAEEVFFDPKESIAKEAVKPKLGNPQDHFFGHQSLNTCAHSAFKPILSAPIHIQQRPPMIGAY